MFTSTLGRYVLADEGGEYSADPADYWFRSDEDRFSGVSLVKLSHPFTTTTGQVVLAPRILKNDPTMRDLRRIARAMCSSDDPTNHQGDTCPVHEA